MIQPFLPLIYQTYSIKQAVPPATSVLPEKRGVMKLGRALAEDGRESQEKLTITLKYAFGKSPSIERQAIQQKKYKYQKSKK